MQAIPFRKAPLVARLLLLYTLLFLVAWPAASGQPVVTKPGEPGIALTWGQEYQIEWASFTSHLVIIELLRNGTVVREIRTIESGQARYLWTVPEVPAADNYRIQIRGVTSIEIAQSEHTFSIVGPGVTEPGGPGSIWRRGQSYTIRWLPLEDSEFVIVELIAPGVAPLRLSPPLEPNDGAFPWTVPADIAPRVDYRIRVSSTSVVGLATESADFQIAPDRMVTSPAGGSTVRFGTPVEITWEGLLEPGPVSINLLKAGQPHLEISSSTANTGDFTWNIPDSLRTASDYRLRIQSIGMEEEVAQNSAPFTIVGAPRILAPEGEGVVWIPDRIYEIRWEGIEGTNANLSLRRGDAVELTTTVANTGVHQLLLPSSITLGTDYRIRVQGLSPHAAQVALSLHPLTITRPRILVPNATGIVWDAGTTQDIRWEGFVTAPTVLIDLYIGDTQDRRLASGVPSNQPWQWAIPASLAPRDDYRIQIIAGDSSSSSRSANPFTIRAAGTPSPSPSTPAPTTNVPTATATPTTTPTPSSTTPVGTTTPPTASATTRTPAPTTVIVTTVPGTPTASPTPSQVTLTRLNNWLLGRGVASWRQDFNGYSRVDGADYMTEWLRLN